MEENKKHFQKKQLLAFSVLFVFFFILICGTMHSAQKSNEAKNSNPEKTISTILSVLSGNHLAVDLTKPGNNNQGDDSDEDEEKNDKKKSESESDPYGNNGSRTSKKKANSED